MCASPHVLQNEKAKRPDVWNIAAIVLDSLRIVSSDVPRLRSADSYAATKIFPKKATITAPARPQATSREYTMTPVKHYTSTSPDSSCTISSPRPSLPILRRLAKP